MSGGYFEELDTEECRALVASRGIGRVAFASEGRIVVLPIAYQTDPSGVVVFATAPDGRLGTLASGCDVTFQIDDIDVSLADGWSVMGYGHTTLYGGSLVPRPWTAGHDGVRIAIHLASLTGRAVSASADAD